MAGNCSSAAVHATGVVCGEVQYAKLSGNLTGALCRNDSRLTSTYEPIKAYS